MSRRGRAAYMSSAYSFRPALESTGPAYRRWNADRTPGSDRICSVHPARIRAHRSGLDPKACEDFLDAALGVAPGPNEGATDIDIVGQAHAIDG